MRSVRQTAILLAVILNRSEQTRARLSGKSIKVLGRRKNLRSAFVVSLTEALLDYDWVLCELGSGAFGAIAAKTLEAAKPVTAKRGLTDDERRDLRRDDLNWSAFEKEADPEQEDPSDDE